MMGQPTNDLLTLPSDMRGKTVEEVWADLSDGSDASPGSSSMMHAVSHKQLMQSSGDLNEVRARRGHRRGAKQARASSRVGATDPWGSAQFDLLA